MSAIALPRAAAAPARSLTRGRIGLLAVLALAAVLCLWNLTISGYSNEYYAAAAKAGSESWTAWFFGSLDPGSFITVDKPPLSLWLTGLSARLFGRPVTSAEPGGRGSEASVTANRRRAVEMQ